MEGPNVVLAVAVPAAVLGAASLGLASSAQAVAVRSLRGGTGTKAGWLAELPRRPMWLLGIVATAAALGLQVLALEFGPLLVVQPLLVTNLPFAVVLSAVLMHRAVDWSTVAASFVCVVGLGALLALAHPSGNDDAPLTGARLLGVAAVLAVLVAAGLALFVLSHGPTRILGLALVTGVGYGVTAGLMKVVSVALRSGLAAVGENWAFYAVCVVGPLSFVLSQHTFGHGQVLAPALAVITTVDPLVSGVVGVLGLGESADLGPATAGFEFAAVVAIIAGIAYLARRATGDPGPRHVGRHRATSVAVRIPAMQRHSEVIALRENADVVAAHAGEPFVRPCA